MDKIASAIKSRQGLIQELERERTELLAKETAERIKLMEKEQRVLEKQRDAIVRALEAAKQKYEEYGRRIVSIEEEIAEVRRSTASKIAEIRRRGMTPEEEEADRLRELRRLYEEYYRTASPEEQKRIAETIQEIADGLRDQGDAIKWLQIGEQLRIGALQEIKGKAEEAKEAEAQRIEELKKKLDEADQRLKDHIDKIEAMKKELEGLGEKLTEMEGKRTIVEIDADISDAMEEIEKLKKELKKLESERHQLVIEARGGVTKGFSMGGLVKRQAGGFVPGYGGGDRVFALLEPGEFVLRKEVVRSLGLGFLERLNRRMTSFGAVSKWGPSFEDSGKVFTLVVSGERIKAVTDSEMLRRLERAFERQRLVGINP